MIIRLLSSTAFLSTLLLGTMTGFFYAFSVTVMPGLDVSQAGTAVDGMQGINRAVRNPMFFATFFFAPVVPLVGAVLALVSGARQVALWLFLASATYIGGAFLPTSLINVPMNEALALVTDAGSFDKVWENYSPRWTAWNTARTLFCLIATLFATFAVYASAAFPKNRL